MLIFLAVALLMNYHEKQFVNKLSLAWLVIGFAGSVYYCSFVQGDENELLLARLTCGVVVAWGLLVLNILRIIVQTPELAGHLRPDDRAAPQGQAASFVRCAVDRV